jgi:hypothetical protein
MAPLSHFAVAVLTATFVAAAPVPTQSNSATSLYARGLSFMENAMQDLIFDGFNVWLNTPGFDNKENMKKALDYEKEQFKGGNEEGDEGDY